MNKMWIPLNSSPGVVVYLRKVTPDSPEVVQYGAETFLLTAIVATSGKVGVKTTLDLTGAYKSADAALTVLETAGGHGPIQHPEPPKSAMDEAQFAKLLETIGGSLEFDKKTGKFIYKAPITDKGYTVRTADGGLERRFVEATVETEEVLLKGTSDLARTPIQGMLLETDVELVSKLAAQTGDSITEHLASLAEVLK